MENTCKPSECKLFDLLGGTPEQCPNYVESWWVPNNKGVEEKPALIKDCAPKRTFLMIQETHNRMTGVQIDLEQQRKESEKIQEAFIKVVGAIGMQIAQKRAEVVIEGNGTNQIPEGL